MEIYRYIISKNQPVYILSLRTKGLVKLDRFNKHVLLVKERTLLELIFTKAPFDAVDKCVLSTNHWKSFSQLVEFQGSWYQFISISLFAIALYSCPQPVNVPSTTRNKPWNTLEPSGNNPWTTRETSVLETQKTGLETRKNDFVPWTTRETPVKHPWSIREAPVNDPGTLNEHALTGKWFPSFCRFPISNAVCHSTICMSLWTKSLSR